MVSRRKFLQANATGLALPLMGRGGHSHSLRADSLLANSLLAAANPTSPIDLTDRDYWNDWPLYLTAKVNAVRAERQAALAALRTEADVRARIQAIRSRVWELVGGPLEKTPLNPTHVGTIERKTYRIEKIIFESQPQVYVTANLYVPNEHNSNASAPYPGIIAPLGHTSNGKEYRNYQYAFQNLARMGFVVLAFDPFGQGERHQYLDPKTGKSRLGPTGEHTQAGRPLLLLRANFALYRVWDAIRALDYLLTRPEVDPARIGCVGHSGGGTVTMYLCALEPRIQVAVEVEGNSENFAGPQYDPPGAVADAEQNLVGGLAASASAAAPQPLIDRGDLLMAFARKPLLMCYTPQDAGATYSPHYAAATQEIYQELKAVYRIMGAENDVQLFTSSLPHDLDFLNRRATYAWFNQWLGNKDLAIEEAEYESSAPGTLDCTKTGQVLTSLGGRSVLQVNIDRARAVVPPSPLQNPSANSAALKERTRNSLRRLLALPQVRTPLTSRVLSTRSGHGLTIEEFQFRSEPEIRLPGWFIKPTGSTGPLPTIVYVSSDGKNRVVEEPNEISALAQQGLAICAIDLRGQGFSTPRPPQAGPLFYRGDHADAGYAWAGLTLGKPVLGQRVWDFIRCLDYLATRPDVDQTRIYVLGLRGGALPALMGAVLDDRPRAVALAQMLSDFRAVVESETYSLDLTSFVFGILRELDVPDLVASLAPRACWLVNATDARGETLPLPTIEGRYQLARDHYARTQAADRLRLFVQPNQELGHLVRDWLAQS